MGTDIHGIVQTRYRPDQEWRWECGINDDRNYRLFAALANVRNGAGFAGVYTHEPIRPISEPRGWPDDFKLTKRSDVGDWSYRCNTCMQCECHEEWHPEWVLGDHSYTWLTLDEILNWDGWDQPLNAGGYISRQEYLNWDGVNPPPDGWSGLISGRDIVTIDSNIYLPSDLIANPNWTHVRVYWGHPLRESCESFLKWAEYIKAKTKGYEARLILGFDS